MMAHQDTKEQDRLGPVVLLKGTLSNLEARRREPEANAQIGLSHMTYYLWPLAAGSQRAPDSVDRADFSPSSWPAACGCDDVQRLRRESVGNAFSPFLSPSMHCA